MNKATHLQASPANQAARDNKVNQNLSPSLARIHNRAATTPVNSQINTEKKSKATAPVNEPNPARPTTARPQHLASNTGKAPQILSPAAISSPQVSSNSARIAPWLIASITLTLALFSGNYAWHTQQQVEKMNARLQRLEAAPVKSATYLPESSEQLAKAEGELQNLNLAQKQLASTLTALQNRLTNTSGLASSRLVTLESELAKLSALMPSALAQESSSTQAEHQAALAQGEANTATTRTTDDSAIKSGPKSNDAREYWFINIASFSDTSAANNSYEKVLKIADKASVKPLTINGKTLYRVRAEGYSSLQAAENEAQVLQARLGLSGLWISRN